MPLLQQVAVGPPPLPGGVAAVLRFFFNLPSWFQIGGFFFGVLVAAVVAFYLWRKRRVIWQWLLSRPRQTQLALGAAAAICVIGASGAGYVSNHYMQHNNGFCTGCHVMKQPWQKFQGSSKHDTLSCHSCHQQGMYANVRQLYLWVAERPEKIGMHAKVPTRICAGCHITDQPKQWQRIATTAGHRTHLESDSSALKGVQCVTCHGLEVHSFRPVDSTCSQTGCHVGVQVVLGRMRGRTDVHCVMCHEFRTEVPRLATRDSAAGALRPTMEQCFKCHQMQAILADFDPARDPHRATCGMCHNPHTQKRPADAKQSCTSAQCHVGWRADPFHVGKNHGAVSQDCTLCHAPHHAKVDASDCAGCHAAVRARKSGHNPPMPFDTLQALRRTSTSWRDVHERRPKEKGDGPQIDRPPGPVSAVTPAATPTDTFPHDRHKQLACITCHTSKQGHGGLTFTAPRGCQICHHQAPGSTPCASCHADTALAPSVTESLTVTVASHAARPRIVSFAHAAHQSLRCVECHTTPVTLAPASEVKSCGACHDRHHTAARDCAGCHSGAWVRDAHAAPVETHAGCDACHKSTTVALLVPDRGLCLTCHEAQRAKHYADRECSVCHLQATPEQYRSHLLRAAGGS